jgi:hypothetical protein
MCRATALSLVSLAKAGRRRRRRGLECDSACCRRSARTLGGDCRADEDQRGDEGRPRSCEAMVVRDEGGHVLVTVSSGDSSGLFMLN